MVLDCIKSELDLFVEPQTNTSIESGKWADYYPISSLDDGPIDFVVHASEHYIQLNKTMLYLNVSISNFENTSECAPINNLASSLFSTVSLTLNDTVIENSNGYYPYKSYLLDLLNQDEESKNSILQSALYFKDDAGQFDNTKLVKDETNKTPVNSGFVQRRQFFVSSKNSVDLYSKLNLDLFNSDKYLINNVTIRLRLIQNNAVFYMLCNKNKTFSIKINKCQLFIRKVKISPAIIVAHNLALEKATAKYPIKRVVVTSLQIQLGIKETIFSNICLGPLPNRIVLGLVESDAQSGNYEKNPFNFLHFNLAKISLTLESTEIPYGQPLEFNYQKNNYIRGYHSLFEGIDKPFGTGNDISRSEYPNGYCLYAFDLTPDLCSSEHINLVKTGELSVKLSFSENTDKVLSLIILKEFDNLVECSYSRQFGINFQT